MASEADISNRIPITVAMMLATLMNTLDSTIANVALPHMEGNLSASQDQATWVLTSYILATAIMTPLSGWLSLKIGRKPMLLISITAFTAASMLCGIAQNLPQMVLFRFLQGMAGASVMPLSQTIMLDLYPQRLIPTVMSLWSATVILGPIIGPGLGGWLTENFSWRWCFYINVPIGALAISGIYIFMSRDRGGLQRPFDFLGFGALVAFVACFQLMTDRGPTQDWFGSKEIWTYAIIAMVGFYVFIVQTLTAEHPFFHRDLAKDRNFVAGSAFGVCVGALLFSTTALLPSFMQNLLGYSAYQAGIASMPRGVGSLVAFLAVPYFIRLIGARRVLACGVAISITALWMMAHFNLQMTAAPIMTSGVIQGFGTGLLFAPLNSLSYVSLNPVHRTEGTIVATMARSLGSSLGISMMSATLVNESALAHARIADRINCGDPVLGATLPGLLNPCSGSIAAFNGEVTRQAAMIGYDTIFAWMALFTVLLLPLLLLMRSPPPATLVAIETPAE